MGHLYGHSCPLLCPSPSLVHRGWPIQHVRPTITVANTQTCQKARGQTRGPSNFTQAPQMVPSSLQCNDKTEIPTDPLPTPSMTLSGAHGLIAIFHEGELEKGRSRKE